MWTLFTGWAGGRNYLKREAIGPRKLMPNRTLSAAERKPDRLCYPWGVCKERNKSAYGFYSFVQDFPVSIK